MNIVDKIIQNLCGDSGADTAAERKKPAGTSSDKSGIIWKSHNVTPRDKERARAAYLKITADGYEARDDFNADNGFTDSFLLLDSFDALQKERFMKICRELAESCCNEKVFYDKNRRGCFYGYVCDSFDKPDLSVMRGISPEDFPYFLAVAAVCKSGYVREEALRLGAGYPMLLSIIMGGFNDNVKQVRAAAEKAFDTALDSLIRVVEGSSDNAFNADTDPGEILGALLDTKSGNTDEPRYIALAILFRTRRRLSEISRGGRFDPEKLSAAEKRLDEITVKNLNEESIKYFAHCHIRLTVGWFDFFDRLCVYRELYRKRLIDWETTKYITAHDRRVSGGACYMASVYTELPEEGLRELAACSERRARRNAAARLFEEYGLWEGAEKMLTDPAAIVRETAVYYFEKLTDMDLHGFYMDRLPEIPAIGGLALCSRTEEQRRASAETIRPLINSEKTRTAAAAVHSLAALGVSGEELYSLIPDPRPGVSKTALKGFLHLGEPVDCKRIYNDILAAGASINARRLTSALLRQSVLTVKVLPWAIRLCDAQNEYVKSMAQIWVKEAFGSASCLYGLGSGDKEEIRKALDETKGHFINADIGLFGI